MPSNVYMKLALRLSKCSLSSALLILFIFLTFHPTSIKAKNEYDEPCKSYKDCVTGVCHEGKCQCTYDTNLKLSQVYHKGTQKCYAVANSKCELETDKNEFWLECVQYSICIRTEKERGLSETVGSCVCIEGYIPNSAGFCVPVPLIRAGPYHEPYNDNKETTATPINYVTHENQREIYEAISSTAVTSSHATTASSALLSICVTLFILKMMIPMVHL